MSDKGKISITVGYKYYAGLHMVFCEDADELLEIAVGDKTAWTGNVTENSTIYIYQPVLFGGEGREGGIQGEVDVMFGKDNQEQNNYLREKLGPDIPAFRGVVSLVGKQMYVSALNPYIKPWKAKFRRIPAKGWLPEYANIEGNANPAHIIYEVITEHGLGQIDEESFEKAAKKLYEEKFGISTVWNGGSIEEFLQMILDHIGGFLFVNPTTGLFQLKLIGDYNTDYDTASIPLIEERHVKEMVSYQRLSLSDTINQLTVYYTDAETGEERSVCVQNLANFSAQGRVVSEEKKYLGITNLELATKVALRDLAASSALLGKITLKVVRTHEERWNEGNGNILQTYSLLPGSVFRFKWPKLGIEEMYFRIGEIDYGTPNDSVITIEAMEDVYYLPEASYINVQEQYWQDPIQDPAPCPQEGLIEASYWDLVRTLSPADFNQIPKNEGYGIMCALGSRPNSAAINYDLYTSVTDFPIGDWPNKGTGNFCPVAYLAESVGRNDTVFQITNGVDLDLAEVGPTAYAIIGGYMPFEYEIVRVDAITRNTVTVGRGCLDTVPKKHNAGTVIFFASGWLTPDMTERVSGQQIYARICPRTSKGTLSKLNASSIVGFVEGRFDRPYPPGRFTVNGILQPDVVEVRQGENIILSWAHRDRTQQTAYIVDHTEGNIGPEPGVTYTVEVYRSGYIVPNIKEENITGTTYIITPTFTTDTKLIILLSSFRDGFKSLQRNVVEVNYFAF